MSQEPGPPRAATRVSVRWDDCDRFGHVNNAAYLALFRAALDRLLPELTGQTAGVGRLRWADLAYREPTPRGTEAAVELQLVAAEPLLVVRGVLLAEGRPRVEADLGWAPGPRDDTAEPASPALPLPERDARGLPFRWRHAVRTYELGDDRAVRPTVIMQWFEHSVFRGAGIVGWSRERMEAADFVTLVVAHRVRLAAPAVEGDEVEIASRLIDLRRVSGTWLHEARRVDGTLLATDHNRGAFLDLAGRIRPAPPGLMAALLGGEPGPRGPG